MQNTKEITIESRMFEVIMLPSKEISNSFFGIGDLLLVTGKEVSNLGELQICGVANKLSNNNSLYTKQHLYSQIRDRMLDALRWLDGEIELKELMGEI